MQETLQALGGILLKAIPTVILLIILHFYLKAVLFGPLDRVMQKRRELTEGARKIAEESLAAAARKADEYEAKLRDARAVVYKQQEEIRKRWLEEQAQQMAEARTRSESTVKTAREAIAQDVAAARKIASGHQRRGRGSDRCDGFRQEGRMKRVLVLVILSAATLAAAEGSTEVSPVWKWANFAILAVGLGYLMAKSLPGVFTSRPTEIQKGISESQQMKQDAERRSAEMDARLNALGADIEKFKTQSAAEMQQEGERISRETPRKSKRSSNRPRWSSNPSERRRGANSKNMPRSLPWAWPKNAFARRSTAPRSRPW